MKLAIAALLVIARVASAESFELAGGPLEKEAPYIDLLTFGVGEPIFEKFGHAAICLRYHDGRNQAVCFNYGVTSFEDGGGLAWGFLRGAQQFWVEPAPFGVMYSFYQYEDRDVWRQTLPLTEPQARAIEAALWKAVGLDQLTYIYDHLYDNCSTRLRDVIDQATGGKLHNDALYPLTFREMAIRGFAESPMLVASMDLLLGRGMDVQPTMWEAMFHPDVLRSEVQRAFGVVPEPVYKRHGAPYPTEGGGSHRLIGLWLALVLALPLAIVRFVKPRSWVRRAAIAWAAVPLGLVGLALWALAILSPVGVVRWNELVLALVPFDLALPFFGPRLRRRYASVRVAMLVLVSLLRAIGVFHQPLWVPLLTAFVPLALLAWPSSTAADS